MSKKTVALEPRDPLLIVPEKHVESEKQETQEEAVKNGTTGGAAHGNGQTRRSFKSRSEVSIPSVFVDVNMLPPDEEVELSGILATEKVDPTKPLPFCKRYLGIFLALSSSVFFSGTTLIAKVLSARYHVLNLGFWRFQGVMIPGIVCIIYQQCFGQKSNIFGSVFPLSKPGSKKTIFLLITRSVVGCTALLLNFYAMTFISLADTAVISFSTPILTTVLAYLMLHEAFSIVQICMAVLSLLGVIIVARPPFLTGAEEFDMDTLIGTGLALACMLCATCVFICLRFLRESHYLLVTLVFGIWGSFQCLVIALAMGVFRLPEGPTDWALGITLAVLTFCGQSLITVALQHEQSGIISLVRCMDVIFSFIFQFIFLDVYPDLFSILGALLVVISVVTIGFRKWVLELPEKHSSRKTFKLLLN